MRAESLGCNFPAGIAIFPQNFASAPTKNRLSYEPSAYDIRTLFKTNGISETPLEREGDRFLMHLQESRFTELVLPVIFVSSAFITQNPHLVSIALNVISNYVTDWFKNNDSSMYSEDNRIKLEIIVETKQGDSTRVRYNGPLGGMDKLRETIDAVHSQSQLGA